MKRFYIYLFAAFCTAFWGACTGNFRELNDDLSGISDGDLEADDNGFGYRLQIVQQGIYFNYDFGKGKNWPFQMTQNLNADMFSGYMHDPKPLQGGSHNSDYNLQDGWNSAMWQFTYSYVMPQIYQLEQTAREKMPPFYAIAKILKVLAMHRVTDYYGPVIYSHFADRGSEYVPDSQQQGCQFPGAAAQSRRALPHGKGMQVSDHIQAVIIRLQQGPVAHRADIVAQSRRAGGLNARKNPFTFFFCHNFHLL